MGRLKENEIGRSLSKRLDSKAEAASENTAPASASIEKKSRQRTREGMHYIGFHASDDQFERLRILAFESRREKQDIMREGLEMVLRKYGA